MKRSVLIFSPLMIGVASVFIFLRSSATEPPPPPAASVTPAASVSSGSSPLPQQLEKSSQIQTIQSAEEKERLKQPASDQILVKAADEKSREEKYRKVADILNGESYKKSMAALFKEWGEDDKALQKTLDVFYNMDMQNLREIERRNVETSLEVRDRTDPAKRQASKEQHEMNCALIIARRDRELLAILGSYLRLQKVTAIKFDAMTEVLDARSRSTE